MKLICPECKNEVDLSAYPSLKEGDVIEDVGFRKMMEKLWVFNQIKLQ